MNDVHRCAGYIYNADWIVTSASCVYGLDLCTYISLYCTIHYSFAYDSVNTSQLKVVAGQLSLTATDAGEETFNVLISHLHQLYNAASKKNNIAMLQVSSIVIINYL